MPNFLENLDECIQATNDYTLNQTFRATVVVVTYRRPKLLLECLDSLQQQSVDDFEIIVVDNGGNESIHKLLAKYHVKHIVLKKNYGLSCGRNIGTFYASSNIVISLDDDAVTHKEFVKKNIDAHEQLDIVGLRGRIFPQTDLIYNELQQVYDLGAEVKPHVILGGVSSFKRTSLMDAGGFNPQLYGHEDGELSYRLVEKFGKERVVYYPDVIIYHDDTENFKKYITKIFRHAVMKDRLRKLHPEISTFLAHYDVSRNQLQNDNQNFLHRFRRHLIWRLGHLVIKIAECLCALRIIK